MDEVLVDDFSQAEGSVFFVGSYVGEDGKDIASLVFQIFDEFLVDAEVTGDPDGS